MTYALVLDSMTTIYSMIDMALAKFYQWSSTVCTIDLALAKSYQWILV